MAAYRRVYDSRNRQADCQEPGSAPELSLFYCENIRFVVSCPRVVLPSAVRTKTRRRARRFVTTSSFSSGTFSVASVDSPLSSSITPSLFHSRLKTFLFCKSFPPQPSSSSSPLTPRIICGLFTNTSEHIRFFPFYFLYFRLFSCRFRAGD